MVSPNSPPNPSIVHQFLISNPISSQTQFDTQHFDAYGVDLRGIDTYPHSLGVLPSIQSLGERMSRSIDLVHPSPMPEPPPMPEPDLSHQNQRLSLSLGSGLLLPSSAQFREISHNYLSSEKTREAYNQGAYSLAGNSSLNQSCSNFYGTESIAISVGTSRYLKPAQFLLEEIVSVAGKAIACSNESYVRKLSRNSKRGSLGLCSELKAELYNNGLSMEKQALQAKIVKLISLLEEVERRYEQYYQHIEELVSSFEMIAGLGAGRSYTALALQAMSRHFCSLRDAILSQIYGTRKKILQGMPRISTGLSQLSLFDRESRHNNRVPLQQLGMIPSPRQTWRPIRGLPEISVTILRSWLFEHFLHPYPNESEKLTLSSQTGLSKNQVSNWFINARVRLWKPMIEEMYKEEFADLSKDSNLSSGSNSNTRRGITDQAGD